MLWQPVVDERMNVHVLSPLRLLFACLTTRWKQMRVEAAQAKPALTPALPAFCSFLDYYYFFSFSLLVSILPLWVTQINTDKIVGNIRPVKSSFDLRWTKVLHNSEELNLDFCSCCHWTQSHWPWLKQGSWRPDSSRAASVTTVL